MPNLDPRRIDSDPDYLSRRAIEAATSQFNHAEAARLMARGPRWGLYISMIVTVCLALYGIAVMMELSQ